MEFCAHIARYFAVSQGLNRLHRAKIALSEMGSSVCTLFDFPLLENQFIRRYSVE